MNILTETSESEPLQGIELLKWILMKMQSKNKMPNTEIKSLKAAYESWSNSQKIKVTDESSKMENELFELKRLLDQEQDEQKTVEG